MTAVEGATELDIRTTCEAGLVVKPEDISFHDLTRDTVKIQVKIRNDEERRSEPTSVRLESAPFGAFVPWCPLATLPVPSLEPGESRVLSIEAARPHPVAMGDFANVPPNRVLTALNASPEEASPRRGAGFAAVVELLRGRGSLRPEARDLVAKGPSLPADLWEFVGREQPHWAGNINVFVGHRAVERHFAKALRIYAGRTNLAMFVVGGPGKRDAYAFDLVGLAADWKCRLYDTTGARTLAVGASDAPVEEKQWVEAAAGCMMVMLAMRPPLLCEDGNVQVHVTRRSCQKRAVVEFNLDPTAQGPGCYVA